MATKDRIRPAPRRGYVSVSRQAYARVADIAKHRGVSMRALIDEAVERVMKELK